MRAFLRGLRSEEASCIYTMAEAETDDPTPPGALKEDTHAVELTKLHKQNTVRRKGDST